MERLPRIIRFLKNRPVSLGLALVSLLRWPFSLLINSMMEAEVIWENILFNPSIFTGQVELTKLYTLLTFPLYTWSSADAAGGFIYFLIIGAIIEKKIGSINLLILSFFTLYLAPFIYTLCAIFEIGTGPRLSEPVCGIEFAIAAYYGGLFACWLRYGKRAKKLFHIFCIFVLLSNAWDLVNLLRGNESQILIGYYLGIMLAFAWISFIILPRRDHLKPRVIETEG